MDLTLFSRCVLAGLLASSVEIAFFSLTGLELGRLVVLTHLAWLAGAGTVTGMVAWVSNESLVARLWFVVPSLVALLPLCQGRSKIRPPWRRKTRPFGSWVEWRNAAVRRGRQDAGVAAGGRAFLLCSRR